jgi:hypothetical protein
MLDRACSGFDPTCDSFPKVMVLGEMIAKNEFELFSVFQRPSLAPGRCLERIGLHVITVGGAA